MESVAGIQTLDKVVCISFCANTLKKSMDASVFTLVTIK